MKSLLFLALLASFFKLTSQSAKDTNRAAGSMNDRIGRDEGEDGNILLWQELKERVQRIEKNRAFDLKRIRKLEDENERLRLDLHRLSSLHNGHRPVQTANWKRANRSASRRRRSATAVSDEKSVEYLSDDFETALQDEIADDVQFLESEKPIGRHSQQLDEQRKKIDGLFDRIKRLADRVSAIADCCNRTEFSDPRDRPLFPSMDVDRLKERVHHTSVSVAQIQRNQYEMRDQQKWLILQIEQINNELVTIDEDRKKVWTILGAEQGGSDRGIIMTSEEKQNQYQLGESSGEADSSGWKWATFVDDAVIVSPPDSPRLEEAERTARDAYSIVTQLKTKLDIIEKDLSKLTGLFRNMEKSQLSQAEISVLTQTIDFVQEALLNVTSRLLENEVIQEKQNSQLQTDLGDVLKRLRLVALQTEKVKRLAQVVREHQVDHFSAIQQFRQDLNALEANVLRLGMKLTNFQTDVLNATLASYKESNKDLQQDVQIADLHSRIDRVDGKFPEIHQTMKDIAASVRPKADRAEVKNIGAEVQKLVEKLQLTTSFNTSLASVAEAVKILETQLPTDCSMSSVPYRLSSLHSGAYVIKPKGSPKAIVVYCEIDTPTSSIPDPVGWTVVQKRAIGREDFNRTWQQYRFGFGDAKQEYWLGNEYIHMLTRQTDTLLRVDVWDIFGEYYYAEYGTFKVASFEEGYRLDIGQHSGNLTDALKHHNGMRFSAFDVDSDASSTHCARYYASGWWFSNCQKANLNGVFPLGVIWFSSTNNDWLQLQKTTMKVRPADEERA